MCSATRRGGTSVLSGGDRNPEQRGARARAYRELFILPHLMVDDMSAEVAFYRAVAMAVFQRRDTSPNAKPACALFSPWRGPIARLRAESSASPSIQFAGRLFCHSGRPRPRSR